jgi:hypothetical protein
MSIRPVIETRRAEPHIEGAGVHLHRAFGFQDPTEAGPVPAVRRFPGRSPARLFGRVPLASAPGDRDDHLCAGGHCGTWRQPGQQGNLGPGSLQLMTAGRGILHQEMPKGDEQGRMHGFQLWGNLPKALEMTAPRYQDMPSEALPERHEDDGTSIRVVIGDYRGVKSPVDQAWIGAIAAGQRGFADGFRDRSGGRGRSARGPGRGAEFHRHADLVDQLARRRADDMAAQNAVGFLVGQIILTKPSAWNTALARALPMKGNLPTL